MEKSVKSDTLDRVEPGRRVKVSFLNHKNGPLCKKLAAMGLVSGGEVEVLGRAPFGDPISVSTLGYRLSLRLSEASQISVSEEC